MKGKMVRHFNNPTCQKTSEPYCLHMICHRSFLYWPQEEKWKELISPNPQPPSISATKTSFLRPSAPILQNFREAFQTDLTPSLKRCSLKHSHLQWHLVTPWNAIIFLHPSTHSSILSFSQACLYDAPEKTCCSRTLNSLWNRDMDSVNRHNKGWPTHLSTANLGELPTLSRNYCSHLPSPLEIILECHPRMLGLNEEPNCKPR